MAKKNNTSLRDRIKKSDNNFVRQDTKGIHKTNNISDKLIRFSFRHFKITEKFCLPKINVDNYLETLIIRLQAVSSLTIKEFLQPSKTLRNHPHDWTTTTEPNGYNLGGQLDELEGWQFCLSSNEHGRVHGILIDDVFYVVWLDVNHLLYPKNKTK
ncbi:MAG: hypothetical protein LWW76_02375 [Burkholderiales bacterium]|nr:hypothetical protein [Burkholderiales bacterium]